MNNECTKCRIALPNAEVCDLLSPKLRPTPKALADGVSEGKRNRSIMVLLALATLKFY